MFIVEVWVFVPSGLELRLGCLCPQAQSQSCEPQEDEDVCIPTLIWDAMGINQGFEYRGTWPI